MRAGSSSASQAPAALGTLQLAQHLGHRLRATQALVRRQVLPVEQKTHEVLQADRFDLAAQALDRVAVDARQQMAFAPLQVSCTGLKCPRST
jgi:hypothetical protein